MRRVVAGGRRAGRGLLVLVVPEEVRGGLMRMREGVVVVVVEVAVAVVGLCL